jgi:hypothetical protein
MRTMKILAAGLLAAVVLPAAAQPAPSQPARHNICLNVRDIQDTSSKDGKIMTFKMRDGTVYNNHLRQTCDSLRFGGFAWTVNSTQEVCEDVQTLRTLTTGEICRLGRFDPPIPKPAATR